MNRRDLLAALGAAGGLAVLADEDGELFAPIVDDGDSDGDGDESGDTTLTHMTLNVTELDQLSEEAGTLSIDPGNAKPIIVGSVDTEYEVVGFQVSRQSESTTGPQLSGVDVRTSDGTLYPIIDGTTYEVLAPFGINPVERLIATADSNNTGTYYCNYIVLYR